jgi:dihydrofolate synthase/folylpolyglutamate synthase
LHRTDFSGVVRHEFGIDGQVFSYGGYERLKIGLLGAHQINNASVAVSSAGILRHKGFNITEAALRRGLENTEWPGRLEVLRRDPVFLIDGAHNPEGATVLRKALDEYFPGRPITLIMGVLSDKDYPSMMETVLQSAGSFSP